MFEGFARSDFSGSPGRVINAHELTPNLSGLTLAAVANAVDLSPAATTLLGRLFAVTLFPATLILAYLTLRMLIPGRPVERLWALTGLAMLPQFMLVHTYVTNDTPTIACASLAVYLAVRGWKNGFKQSDTILLGIALGLAGLHKANGLIVAPMAAGLIAWRLRHDLRRLLQALGTVAVIALAISGWWYARMLVIYGDPIGTATTQAALEAIDTVVPTPRKLGISPWDFALAGWLEGTFRSFWAGYGVAKMGLPDNLYLALIAMLGVAAAGLIGRALETRGRIPTDAPLWTIFISGWTVLWLMNLLSSWTLDGVAMHGRYTYPAIVPFAALLAVGLGGIVAAPRASRFVVALTIPLMIAGNVAYTIHVVVPDVIAFHA